VGSYDSVYRTCSHPDAEATIATETRAGETTVFIPRQHSATSASSASTVRSAWLTWIVPVLVSITLGAWDLTRPALWADELATWGAVRLSLDQLWQLSATVDAVFAPYYAAMKAVTAVAGTSTLALRLPALLAIAGTALVVTALGRRLGGANTGLMAGLLFAILPVSSRYAQEARPYAVVMFAATLATLTLIRLLEVTSFWRAAAYAGALVLTGLSHPLSALLVIGGHVVAIVWQRRWIALAPAAIGALPALVLLVLGSRNRSQISWIRTLTEDAFQAIPERLFLSGAAGGIVLALAVLALRRTAPVVCLAAAAFVPPAGLIAAGFVEPIYVSRYVLVAIPPLTVLAASAALRAGRLPAVLILLLVAMLGYPAQTDMRGPAGHLADSAKIAAVIPPLYRPGDVAVFPDTNPSIPWAARDIYARYLPPPRPPDILQVTPQRTNGRLLATECPDASCLGSPPRIWVIRVDTSTDPFKDMGPGKRNRLSAHYKAAHRWSYLRLSITLLRRKS
jgi:mannosyltransferase